MMDMVNPIVRRWQRDAADDPDAFWARAAAAVGWFRPWSRMVVTCDASFRKGKDVRLKELVDGGIA